MTAAKKGLKSKEDIIAEYLANREILIPLNGKTPLSKEWSKTEFNSNWTPQDFAKSNYGFVLQEDDLIIDYDPRNDDTPEKSAFQNLVNYVGEAFDTYTVTTGGGGYHVYLKKPIGFSVRERLDNNEYPQFAGIEFKTIGRQVVGPGSIHPVTRREYKVSWKSPADERMEAPAKLLELIKKPNIIEGIDTVGEGLGSFTDDDQTVSRFVSYLNQQQPAIEGCGGDLKTYQMACRGRDFNLSPKKNFEILLKHYNPRCIPCWEEQDLWAKVKSAYKNNKDVQGKWNPQAAFDVTIPEGLKKAPIFERDSRGIPKKMLRNVIAYMQLENNPLYELLRYNQFTRNIEFRTRAPWHFTDGNSWSDDDAIQFKAWLSANQSFEITTNLIHEAALNVAMQNAYHPVKDYLEALEWDGAPRLKTWLSEYCSVPESDYTKAIGEKVLLAAVSRIYQPGAKFDHVLILEGPQGVGKSTLVSILGKYWYGDVVLDPHNKDTVDALKGKWIVELSEMECAKKDVTSLKRFISCTTDRVRLAYARTSQDFPRQCVFIGTINPENGRGYLKDSTGNRRYWPVFVRAIDYIRLREDIDQIWAEALAKYKTGNVKLYLEDKRIQELALKEADERYESDPMEDTIADYLYNTGRETITDQEIMVECLMLPASRLDKYFAGRISCAMNRLGYIKGSSRIKGRIQRCYRKRKGSEFVFKPHERGLGSLYEETTETSSSETSSKSLDI